MKKLGVIFAVVLVASLLSVSLVSAGWFSDFWNQATGRGNVQLSPGDVCWSGSAVTFLKAGDGTQAKKFCKCVQGVFNFKDKSTNKAQSGDIVKQYTDLGDNSVWTTSVVSSPNDRVYKVKCDDAVWYNTNQTYCVDGTCSTPTYSCTGGTLANSVICTGGDSGLTVNTPKSLVSTCGTAKCEYICNSGYTLTDGACVANPTCTAGATQSCTVGTCAGTQTCANNAWGTCTKTDASCGALVCVDSDGGLNYSVRGTASFNGSSGTDYCIDSTRVDEYSCPSLNSNFGRGSYSCPNGCVNGACAVNACTPGTNVCAGKTCGSVANGTCGNVSCGSCATGQTCTNNACVANTCNPSASVCTGKSCGTFANGTCGNVVCGTCSGATPNCNAVTGICGAAACTPNAGVCTGKQCGTFANGTCGNVVCGTCSGATPNCNAVTGICGATVEDCSVLTFDADDYDVFSVNISSQKFFFRARNIQTSGLNDVVSLERVSCGSGGTTEVWQTICAGKKAGDDCISGDIEMTIENVTVPDKKVNISSCGATFELIEDFDAGCSPGSCSDLTPNNTCSDTKPGYCSNGNMVNNCSGCGCSVGICNASGVCAIPDTCIDSDAKNYGNKGNVTLGSEFREDSCEDGRLLEYFCNTSSILTGVVDSELNPCSLSCRDGACLTPAEVAVDNCTDTDGPNNYFLKGNVSSTSLGNFSDFCDTVMIVVEYNCNASSGATGETVVNSSFQCTSGCVNGACVASNDDEDFGLYCAPSSLGGQTNNIPIRSRFKGSDDKTYYCNPLTLGASVAKNNGLACVEDYECNSNVCLDGKCTSISQELAAQKGILQQILCRIKSIFTSETYDHCIAAS